MSEENNTPENVIQLPIKSNPESNKNTFIYIKDPLVKKMVMTTGLIAFLAAAIFVNNMVEQSQSLTATGGRQIASVGNPYSEYAQEVKELSQNELNKVYKVTTFKKDLIDELMIVYLHGEYSVKFAANKIEYIEFDTDSKSLEKAIDYRGSDQFIGKFKKYFPKHESVKTVLSDSQLEVVALISEGEEIAKVRFQKTPDNKLLSVNIN